MKAYYHQLSATVQEFPPHVLPQIPMKSRGLAISPFYMISLKFAGTGKCAALAPSGSAIQARIIDPLGIDRACLWRYIQVGWGSGNGSTLIQHVESGDYLCLPVGSSSPQCLPYSSLTPERYVWLIQNRSLFFQSPDTTYLVYYNRIPPAPDNTDVKKWKAIKYAAMTPDEFKLSNKIFPCDTTGGYTCSALDISMDRPIGPAPFIRIADDMTISMAGVTRSDYNSPRTVMGAWGAGLWAPLNDLENEWYPLLVRQDTGMFLAPSCLPMGLGLLRQWQADKYYADSFNRSTVKLRKRFIDSTTQTKPKQGAMPKIFFGFTTNGQERFLQTKSNGFVENFDFWQYLDIYMYIGYDQGWPPIELKKLNLYDLFEGFKAHSGSGIFSSPPKNLIDTAHRNGCKFFGVLFFQQNLFGGKWSWWSNFLKDRIALAEKIVDYAAYFGIDGFFVNFEAQSPGTHEDYSISPFTGPQNTPGTDCSSYSENCDHEECQGYWCQYTQGGIANCDGLCGTQGTWDTSATDAPTNNRGFSGEDINKLQFIEFLKHIREYRKKRNINVEICMYSSMGPGGSSGNYVSGVVDYLMDFWRDPETGEPVVDAILSQPPSGRIDPNEINYTYAHTSEAVKSCVEGVNQWPKNTGSLALSNTITCAGAGGNTGISCDCGKSDCGQKDQCTSNPNCSFDDKKPTDKPWCYSPDVICQNNADDYNSCGSIVPNDSRIPPGRAYDFYVGTDGEVGLFAANYLEQDWAQKIWCGTFAQCTNNIQAIEPPLSSFFLWSANLELNSLGTDDTSRTFQQNTDYYSLLYIGQTGLCYKNLTSDPYIKATQMGLCHFSSERSVHSRLPFHTNFCLGNGDNFYIEGHPQLYFGNWSDNIQDALPTWRWWSRQMSQRDNEGRYLQSKLLSLDYSRAYHGGSCLRVQSQNTGDTDFHLYKTQFYCSGKPLLLSVVFSGETSEVFRGKHADNCVSIGYTLLSGGNLVDNAPIYYFELGAIRSTWRTKIFKIKPPAGGVISSICLKACRPTSNYTVYIGSLGLHEKNSPGLPRPEIPRVMSFTQSSSQLVNYNVAWKPTSTTDIISHYTVFMNGFVVGRISGSDYNDDITYNVQNAPSNATFRVEAVGTCGRRKLSLPSNLRTLLLFGLFGFVFVLALILLGTRKYLLSAICFLVALALFFACGCGSMLFKQHNSGIEDIAQVPGNTGNLTAGAAVQIEKWPQCKQKAFNINFDDNRPKAWTWLLDHIANLGVPIKVTFFINTLWLDRDKEKYLAWMQKYRVDYGVHGHWHANHTRDNFMTPPDQAGRICWGDKPDANCCPTNPASCWSEEQLAANDTKCAEYVRNIIYKDPVRELVYAYPYGAYPIYDGTTPGKAAGDPKTVSLNAIANTFLAARGVQWGQLSEFPDPAIPQSLLGTCSNYGGQAAGNPYCGLSSCDMSRNKVFDSTVSAAIGPQYCWPGGIDLNLDASGQNCSQLQQMEIRKNSLLTLLQSADNTAIMVWGHDFHPMDKNGVDWPCDSTFTTSKCPDDNCKANAQSLAQYTGNQAWTLASDTYVCPPGISKEVDSCATSCVRGAVDASGKCTNTDVFGKDGTLAYNQPTMIYPVQTVEGQPPCSRECFDSCFDPSIGSKLLEMLRAIEPYKEEIWFAFFVEIVQYLWNRKYSTLSYTGSSGTCMRYALTTSNVMRKFPLCISFSTRLPVSVLVDGVSFPISQASVANKWFIEIVPSANTTHVLECFYTT